MDWLKKHADTVTVLGGILVSVVWMNGKFNKIQEEIAQIKTDMAVMKTVLIMKEIMPRELAVREE